jgi:hypothetical protein
LERIGTDWTGMDRKGPGWQGFKKGYTMDWIQTLSIMATVIASAYYIHREIQADIRIVNARTDKLYEMFIDLIKEGRK